MLKDWPLGRRPSGAKVISVGRGEVGGAHRQDLSQARAVEYLRFRAILEIGSREGNAGDLRGATLGEKGKGMCFYFKYVVPLERILY